MMVTCPSCNGEILFLIRHREMTEESEVWLMAGQLTSDVKEGTNHGTEYFCPRCEKSVAKSDSDAIAILSGKKEG